uniref:Transposase n=1 Tax=Ascaris lumbricoides TaxID=6252 RepID=A0A0M3HXL3_ASCLU
MTIISSYSHDAIERVQKAAIGQEERITVPYQTTRQFQAAYEEGVSQYRMDRSILPGLAPKAICKKQQLRNILDERQSGKLKWRDQASR